VTAHPTDEGSRVDAHPSDGKLQIQNRVRPGASARRGMSLVERRTQRRRARRAGSDATIGRRIWMKASRPEIQDRWACRRRLETRSGSIRSRSSHSTPSELAERSFDRSTAGAKRLPSGRWSPTPPQPHGRHAARTR
jgi:hypothetical protein